MLPGHCPICGQISQFRQLFAIEVGKRQIIACKCGHQSIFPTPTEGELQEIYIRKGYYDFWGVKNNLQQIFELKLKTCERLIKQSGSIISTSSNKRRHLDIGCAFGYMMKAAQSAGYESQGLEISPAADEAIKLGYDVCKVMLEDALFPAERFDLITAVDVFEHIPEPRKWLEECKRILKRGGVLMLVTPNCSSLPARIRKGNWPHYKVEHLHYYSLRTLKRLLLNIGFVEISKSIGIRYLNLTYITSHYEKFQPGCLETRALRGLKALSPQKLFEYPFPFPSEMVVIGKKGKKV